MDNFLNQLQVTITTYLPNVLLAIAILIIGWIVALLLSRLTRNLLRRTTLDDRLGRMVSGDPNTQPEAIQTEKWISTIVFWLIILITLVAFFQALDIPAVSRPLNLFLDDIVGYIPGIIGALVLLAIAWLIATILRAVVVRLMNATGLTDRLSSDAEVKVEDRMNLAQTIGNVVYWLIFLLFLPAILDVLNLRGLLGPVQGLVDDILSALPNILAAGLILLIGWLVARIIRQIVTNLLAGLGIDRLSMQAGVSGVLGDLRLSSVIGTIVYILVLIPVIIAALNALNIPAVSEPAANMLTLLLNALPAIFGALLLLGIAYFVARLVGQFVAGILANIGFNRLFIWLGISDQTTIPAPRVTDQSETMVTPTGAAEQAPTRMTPSQLVGYLVTVGIMLFAVMEAADLLGFEILAVLVSDFIGAAANVLIGLLVFALGLYFANLADRIIRNTGGSQADILATVARVAIIIFSGALALREMGIAASIVNLAFGLLLGAVAVAAALAFGLGGREVAGRYLERWTKRLGEGDVPASRGRDIPATGRSDPGMPTDFPGKEGPTGV